MEGIGLMRRIGPIGVIEDWVGEDGSFATLRMTWERSSG